MCWWKCMVKCYLHCLVHPTYFVNDDRTFEELVIDGERATKGTGRFHPDLHTYIKYIIGDYNPSVRIIDLVLHTTYVVCVNFSGRTYSLKSTLNGRFFEKLCMAIFIYSQSFWQKSAKRKSPKKYFLYFILMSGLGLLQYLLDHGDENKKKDV